MRLTRLRRSLALVASAALLASLTAATMAVPTSADEVTCRGKVATIVGTQGDDVLVGTNGRDIIAGLGGDDVIKGLGGHDLICAGRGEDRVKGNQGRDRLYGNAGPDKLFGGKGPDTLEGGVSDDWLKGQKGNDRLDGGPGTDTCHQNQGRGPEVSCELPQPPASEQPSLISLTGILAVAYSDVDGLDGYSTGDVLIAKLVDTHPGGVPSAGDTIEMGRYPTDLSLDPVDGYVPSAYGHWRDTSHTVTKVDTDTATGVVVDSDAGRHFWQHIPSTAELYEEESPGFFAPTAAIQDGLGAVLFAEQIEVELMSPSDPDSVSVLSPASNPKDDPFIDVVLNNKP